MLQTGLHKAAQAYSQCDITVVFGATVLPVIEQAKEFFMFDE